MDDYVPEHRGEEEEEPVVGEAPPTARTLFSNKVYDWLKFLALVILPALAVFYISIAPLWGLPKQEEVAGTLMAIDLLLGAVLGIANRQYQEQDQAYDGHIYVGPGETPETKTVGFDVTASGSDLVGKKEARFKIHEE